MSDYDSMNCKEVFNHLDDYLDRELNADDLARLEAHLSECAHCAEAAQFEDSVLECIRSKVERISAPRELFDRILGVLD